MRRVGLVVCVVLALFAGACGDDDDSDDGGTTTDGFPEPEGGGEAVVSIDGESYVFADIGLNCAYEADTSLGAAQEAGSGGATDLSIDLGPERLPLLRVSVDGVTYQVSDAESIDFTIDGATASGTVTFSVTGGERDTAEGSFMVDCSGGIDVGASGE